MQPLAQSDHAYSNVHIDDLVDILDIGTPHYGDYASLLVWKVIA